MNLFISDLHFGDLVQLKYQERPFSSVEEMDEILISNWNKKVKNMDDVWVIGDMISHAHHDYPWYLRQLNGKKHLIVGNHDYHLVRDKKATGYFVSIDDYKAFRLPDGKMVALNHYPLAEWNGMYKDVYHIYGHIHKYRSDTALFMAKREKALIADCVVNNYMPVTFEDLMENNRTYKEKMLNPVG